MSEPPDLMSESSNLVPKPADLMSESPDLMSEYGSTALEREERISCKDCGEEIQNDALKYVNLFAKNDEDDTIVQLRQKAQGEGVTIEYRCPHCRSCTDCKRSFEKEQVSLREETEEEEKILFR